jgi:hypothetical protein
MHLAENAWSGGALRLRAHGDGGRNSGSAGRWGTTDESSLPGGALRLRAHGAGGRNGGTSVVEVDSGVAAVVGRQGGRAAPAEETEQDGAMKLKPRQNRGSVGEASELSKSSSCVGAGSGENGGGGGCPCLPG